jgi:hypothetical protein
VPASKIPPARCKASNTRSRALDELADQEQERSARMEKALADYQAQADKPFDHESDQGSVFL